MTRHQVTPRHALISKLFDLLLLDCGRPECLLVPPVDVIVSSAPASLLPVLTLLVVTIIISVPSVLVLVIIIASSVATVVKVIVVESLMLLLLVAVILVVVLVVLQVMLKTLLQLLLIRQTWRVPELLLLLLHLGRRLLMLLLLLLLLLMNLMLLSLPVPHAGVVEVVHGRVDVAHVTPVHGHGLRLLLGVHRRPRTSKHHFGLNISECLHARNCRRREGGPVCWRLLELWRLLTHELRRRLRP